MSVRENSQDSEANSVASIESNSKNNFNTDLKDPGKASVNTKPPVLSLKSIEEIAQKIVKPIAIESEIQSSSTVPRELTRESIGESNMTFGMIQN